MSQGLPKRTYYSEAEKGEREAVKKFKAGRGFGGGFAELVEKTPPEVNFTSLLSSTFAGGPVVVELHAEEKDKLKQPQCAWWQLRPGGQPVGPVASSKLDLSQVDEEVRLVAFVAEVPHSGSMAAVFEPDTEGAKVCPGWTAKLHVAGKKGPGRELLSIRRPGGVQPGGAWFVGVLARGGPEGWQAEVIDDVYPANRVAALLPLRCKDVLPPPESAPVEESPADKARRMLEEAMKEGF
mmetsp:Transcript_134454/g.287660  ORF Transcript_134454/g.287660 Transcript_134454/m.287660 type:complete len:238 (-) Transcript_134454:91-804(-)